MADHQSLIRIIGNLIKNAVHYGKDGKVLGIELTETTNDFQLLIWDQGLEFQMWILGMFLKECIGAIIQEIIHLVAVVWGFLSPKNWWKTTDEFGLKAFRGKNDFWFFHPQTQ